MVHDGLGRASVCHQSVTLSSPLEKLVGKNLALSISKCIGPRNQTSLSKAINVFQAHDFEAYNLARYYIDLAKEKSVHAADVALSSFNARLHLREINLSCSLEQLAKAASRLCVLANKISGRCSDASLAYRRVSRLAKRYKLTPPQTSNTCTEFSCAQRMLQEKWWRRHLKIQHSRIWESVRRDLGVVNKYRSPYASVFRQTRRLAEKSNNRHYLENTFIHNELGEELPLKDLYDSSVSNPAVRRAELMVRIRGFEEVAERLHHEAEFYTITVPSRMHAILAKSGKANPKYDQTTPKEAHDYLCKIWTCIRAKLEREGLKPYGFRVVEPHHDGTPHWHLLLFMKPSDVKPVRAIVKHYAERVDNHEIKHKDSRFKAVSIDPSKGTAAGYIAKYISKNIDGAHLSVDLYGKDADKSAKAIESWATCWGVRQFQQLGGPSVSIWRELRRLYRSDGFDELDDSLLVKQSALEAGASDWANFVILMGGPDLKRDSYPISLHREPANLVDMDTGEIVNPSFNRYGEQLKGRVLGLNSNGDVFKTRFHQWFISRPPPDQTGSFLTERSEVTKEPA